MPSNAEFDQEEVIQKIQTLQRLKEMNMVDTPEMKRRAAIVMDAAGLGVSEKPGPRDTRMDLPNTGRSNSSPVFVPDPNKPLGERACSRRQRLPGPHQ